MKIKNYTEFNMKIPNEIIELSKIFKKNKKKLFIVGGYCRDILMNKSPLDIDLATDSLPDDTIKFLSPFYNIDLVGKAFGVIIVHLGKLKIEIASFRKDLEDDTGGRHHKVELGVSIEDDVLRRDITISSIFYDIENKKMVDITGGKNDIKNKVIRMVGDPNIRLKEDPLRALRVLRFACRYSFSINLDTKKALTKISLSTISQERIWEEFEKAFEQAIDFNTYLKYLDEYNMWDEMFPGSDINKNFIKSKNFIIVVTSLFKKMDFSTLERKMVRNWKIQTTLATKVVFLLMLKTLTPENAFNLYKLKLRYFVDDELIIEWLKVNNIKDKIYDVFLEYRPSVTSDYLVSKGFTLNTKALGDEQKRLEIEEFKKLLNSI